MTINLTNLTNAVTQSTTVEESAVILINGIAAELTNAVANADAQTQASINALATQLMTAAAALAAVVAANKIPVANTVPVSPPPANTSAMSWKILPIGAGGFLTGMSIAKDSTRLIRTDTYGGYNWNPSAIAPNGIEGAYEPLFTANSLPFIANAAASSGAQFVGSAVWEAQVAYSNSNVMYMVYIINPGYPVPYAIYKSIDKGLTWNPTAPISNNFAFIPDFGGDVPSNAWYNVKTMGPKFAIDTTNPNNVFVGTANGGFFSTKDGGISYQSVVSVPAAASYNNGQFYPAYSGVAVTGNTAYVYAYNEGVYGSTDGSTFKLLANGPGFIQTGKIDHNTGHYYCVDGQRNGWRYDGAWTQIWNANNKVISDIASDPNLANHIIIGDQDSNLNESFDGGNTWSGFTSNVQFSVVNDITWASIFTSTYNGFIEFDPSTPNTLRAYGERNAYVVTIPKLTPNTQITWQSEGRGIEQLVVNDIICPTSNTPIVGTWDSGVFMPLQNSYTPAAVWPAASAGVIASWCLDYASTDPNFIATKADGFYAGFNEASAFSINGGKNWTPLPNITKVMSQNGTGSIAAASSNNIVFAGGFGNQPYYTLNQGQTWNPITLPGVTDWSKFQQNGTWGGGRAVAADRVNIGTFYLFFQGIGFFQSVDGGATWTLIAPYTQTAFSGTNIKAVPGFAGEFWCMTGDGFNLLHYANGTLTIDQSQNGSYAVGYGKNPTGIAYPSVFTAGMVIVNGVREYGIWRSDNANTPTPTWNAVSGFPNGSFDSIKDIQGDPAIPYKCYVGFGGSGCAVFD